MTVLGSQPIVVVLIMCDKIEDCLQKLVHTCDGGNLMTFVIGLRFNLS